jgi:hypothetical protein
MMNAKIINQTKYFCDVEEVGCGCLIPTFSAVSKPIQIHK